MRVIATASPAFPPRRVLLLLVTAARCISHPHGPVLDAVGFLLHCVDGISDASADSLYVMLNLHSQVVQTSVHSFGGP